MGPVASGFFLDLAGILLVMGGLYALMRELDVERIPAAGMATFVLSAYCYATTAAGIKGDLLAAAFNLWGLAAVSGRKNRPGRGKAGWRLGRSVSCSRWPQNSRACLESPRQRAG